MDRSTDGVPDEASDEARDEARGARELLLDFEAANRGRLRRTLRETLRAAIQEGRLPPHTKLPASRRLAADLGVSRGVVSDAYDQLVSEGYLEIAPRSAPVVAAVASTTPAQQEPTPKRWRFDFNETTPEIGLFPRRAWAKAVQRALTSAPDAAFDYSDHRGSQELRTALSIYLARVRGVRVDPGRLIITQGFTQALDMLCHVLAGQGRTTVAMESPSHLGLWATVRDSGLALTGCPVDEHGLLPEDLAKQNADAVVVSPAHQFPTGAVLAPSRRQALIAWAAKTGGLVIEDDYDAEFRYDRTPVGAVQGLDPERVAHVGSASKSLAPAVRLGWLSAPAHLLDDLIARKSAADSGSPAIDQLALADLLESGEYERHIVRARHAYRRRRDLLARALAARLPGLPIAGAAAGMQLLLPLPDGTDDTALSQEAAARGINISPLSRFHLVPSERRGLLVGFGRLPEHKIEAAVAALARAVGTHSRAVPPL